MRYEKNFNLEGICICLCIVYPNNKYDFKLSNRGNFRI